MNLTMFHAGMIGGPAIAGVLIASAGEGTRGLAWIYLSNAASFLTVVTTLLRMRASGRIEATGAAQESPLGSLRQGLRFVFKTPVMVWTMALDFVATFFSGANALSPDLRGSDLEGRRLRVRVAACGPGLGSARRLGLHFAETDPGPAGTRLPLGRRRLRHGDGRLRPVPQLRADVHGARRDRLADLVSTVVRQIVRQMITPDAMRGRMTSVNMIFFMGGPQLGELEAGVVASLFASAAVGATVSVLSGGRRDRSRRRLVRLAGQGGAGLRHGVVASSELADRRGDTVPEDLQAVPFGVWRPESLRLVHCG